MQGVIAFTNPLLASTLCAVKSSALGLKGLRQGYKILATCSDALWHSKTSWIHYIFYLRFEWTNFLLIKAGAK